MFASPGVDDEGGKSDTFVVVCADGAVAFRYPFIDDGSDPSRLGFSFPSDIFDSRVEMINGETMVAIGVSLKERNEIIAYHVGFEDAQRVGSSDLSATAYSLEELISLAHKVLVEGGRE